MDRVRLTAAQCELIEEYHSYATALARKQSTRAPRHVDAEEVLSRAYLGLVQAVQRWPDYCAENGFDEQFGVERGYLKAYITRRVNGAILDYMREQDWAPRASRELMKRHDDGDSSDEVIAQRSGETIEAVRQARSDVESAPVSTEDILGELSEATMSVEDQLMLDRILVVFAEAADRLPQAEKLVFVNRIYWQNDVKTTAENLGMSPSQVSTCFNDACAVVVEAVLIELEIARGTPGRMLSILEAL